MSTATARCHLCKLQLAPGKSETASFRLLLALGGRGSRRIILERNAPLRLSVPKQKPRYVEAMCGCRHRSRSTPCDTCLWISHLVNQTQIVCCHATLCRHVFGTHKRVIARFHASRCSCVNHHSAACTMPQISGGCRDSNQTISLEKAQREGRARRRVHRLPCLFVTRDVAKSCGRIILCLW